MKCPKTCSLAHNCVNVPRAVLRAGQHACESRFKSGELEENSCLRRIPAASSFSAQNHPAGLLGAEPAVGLARLARTVDQSNIHLKKGQKIRIQWGNSGNPDFRTTSMREVSTTGGPTDRLTPAGRCEARRGEAATPAGRVGALQAFAALENKSA